jgi:hypothetical protein
MEGVDRPIEVFVSYSHKDEELMKRLREHMTILRRQHVITDWHDGEIRAGETWAEEITERLESASVILLLVSSSFLASDFVDSVELKRALERHDAGEVRVIPVMLRPVAVEGSSIATLQMLPEGAKPVTLWPNRDEAFRNIAEGIKRAISPPPAVSDRVVRDGGRGVSSEPSAHVHQRLGGKTDDPGSRVQTTNTTEPASAPMRISVQLRFLTELDEQQTELDSFVRLYIELESGERSTKATELIALIRKRENGEAPKFWGEMESKLRDLKPFRGVWAPPSAFQAQMKDFNQQLDEANSVVRLVMDPTRRSAFDPDQATAELLSSLYKLFDLSESMLDTCRTGAEKCLRNISSLLKLILDRVPEMEDAQRTTTQPQHLQEYAGAITRKERAVVHGRPSYTSVRTVSGREGREQ